jgi:hypothetical protein
MDQQHDEVLADRGFLAEARHAFLIRRPEEIAASYYALFPPMTIKAIGMERLCEMQAAIGDAGGKSFYEQIFAQRMDVTPWE